MAVPDYQSLMAPLLQFVVGKERSVSECIDHLCGLLRLTEQEREEMLPSGRQRRMYSRTAWAATYLVQAGLVDRPMRGKLIATDVGKAVAASQPGRIDNQFLMQFEPFVEFRLRGRAASTEPESVADVSIDNSSPPEERIDEAVAEIEAALKTELLERILEDSPEFFEQLIVDLMTALGYGSIDGGKRIGGSHDGGVDGVISEDALGLNLIYLQAKRYDPAGASIQRGAIQAFVGSLVGHGATRGVFVTTSRFSKPAMEYAALNTQQRLVLIDGKRLTSLMLQYGVGVRVARSARIMRIDHDYFEAS